MNFLKTLQQRQILKVHAWKVIDFVREVAFEMRPEMLLFCRKNDENSARKANFFIEQGEIFDFELLLTPPPLKNWYLSY